MGDAADDDEVAWARGDYEDDDEGGDGNLGRATYSSLSQPPVNVGRVRALRESEKAIYVERFTGTPPSWQPAVWMPKSQIFATSQVKANGDVGDLIVTAWIAREKGWRAVAPTPTQPQPRDGKFVTHLTVTIETIESTWTAETLLAELRKIYGVRGVELKPSIVPKNRARR